MSLKSKIEAVIYASEEPVTLAQLVILLSEEAQSELDALAARQAQLPLGDSASVPDLSTATPPAPSADAAPADGTSDGREASSPAAPSEEPASGSAPEISQISPAADDASASPGSGEADKRLARERERAIRDYLRGIVDGLMREYTDSDRGLEIREVAGGFRFGTKPEYHDAVRGFVKSLKPALKLSLQALETLAVVAYKQPVTAAEISEIRGVDSAGVLGGLLTRKLIQTAGRKQVIGRPMLYKTSKEFLVRFGLRDIQELPSMEEFERMAGELTEQEDLPMEGTDNIIEETNARGDAEHIRETNQAASQDETASPAEEAGQLPDSATGTAPPAIPGTRAPDGAATNDDPQSSPRSEAEPPTASQEPA